ncbi:hypothetical protein [Streptomyces sp. NPDC051183]|uniref:hypothetical protein n=1 Tax=Streptomyces sp. NPDC051183 TaxID=3155165 RepID=UPI00343340AB
MADDLIPLRQAFAEMRAEDLIAERAPSYADPSTGEIRVLRKRCTTCLLNPAGTAVELEPGRLQAFIEAVRSSRDGTVVCHSTLDPVAPLGTPAAMCRGYTAAYGLPAAATEAIDSGLGHLVEVPEPVKLDSGS